MKKEYSKAVLKDLYHALAELDSYADILRAMYKAEYRLEDVEQEVQDIAWDVVEKSVYYILLDMFEDWAGVEDKDRDDFYETRHEDLMAATANKVEYIECYPKETDSDYHPDWDAVKLDMAFPIEFFTDLEEDGLVSIERDEDPFTHTVYWYLTYGVALKDAAGL